jgi:1,4-alpha-glucan branching enzyme
MHDAFEHYFSELGALYEENDAFWNHDYEFESFQWMDADNKSQNLFTYVRKGTKKDFLIVLNFSTNSYENQQIGVHIGGKYKEVVNSQWSRFNGNYKTDTPQTCQAVRLPRNNQPYMIQINVPSLGATILEVEK